MVYQGSCHCGKIAFDVQGELTGAMACNCSMCQRKGARMWFLPQTSLTLHTPRAAMASYTFNKHVIEHHFCPTCGIHPFGEGKDPKGNPMVAVNINCLENVDLSDVTISQYDGKHA